MNINKKEKNKNLHKKIKYNNRELVINLKLFAISGSITLFPFLFLIVRAVFEGKNLQYTAILFQSFFKRSDMLLAIIAITSASALINVFSGKYKFYVINIICWFIIICCGMYFCAFNPKSVSWSRVLAVFILAIICSIINIFHQAKRQ